MGVGAMLNTDCMWGGERDREEEEEEDDAEVEVEAEVEAAIQEVKTEGEEELERLPFLDVLLDDATSAAAGADSPLLEDMVTSPRPPAGPTAEVTSSYFSLLPPSTPSPPPRCRRGRPPGRPRKAPPPPPSTRDLSFLLSPPLRADVKVEVEVGAEQGLNEQLFRQLAASGSIKASYCHDHHHHDRVSKPDILKQVAAYCRCLQITEDRCVSTA